MTVRFTTMGIDRRERCDNGHLLCIECQMCSAWECPRSHNDEQGRVTTDKHGEPMHTECRRMIRLYGEVY